MPQPSLPQPLRTCRTKHCRATATHNGYCHTHAADRQRREIQRLHNSQAPDTRTEKYGNKWKDIRTETLERAGNRCQTCGTHQSELPKPLQVHHEPTGGYKALCVGCHRSSERRTR